MATTILEIYTNNSTVAKNYKYIPWGLVITTTHRELKLPNQITLLQIILFLVYF